MFRQGAIAPSGHPWHHPCFKVRDSQNQGKLRIPLKDGFTYLGCFASIQCLKILVPLQNPLQIQIRNYCAIPGKEVKRSKETKKIDFCFLQ